MIEFLGGVVPFLAFLLGFWLMRPRRKQRAAVKTNPVAGLLRWHAVWERDNPDLIIHASYTDYLPKPADDWRRVFEPPRARLVPPPAKIPSESTRPTGLRAGLKYKRPSRQPNDISGMIATFTRDDFTLSPPSFSPGGYIPSPIYAEQHCEHCFERVGIGRRPDWICTRPDWRKR